MLLTVPSGQQSPNSSSAKDFLLAPRTLQPIDGDFEVEVVIEHIDRPKLKPATPSTPATPECSVESGLLIWQDEKNFISWTSAAVGELPTLSANLTVVRNGKLLQRRWSVSDTSIHLKVFRENGRVNVALSEDGLFWRMPRFSTDNFITNTLAAKLQFGVIALNGADSEFKTQFRKLSVKRDTRVMIHGNLNIEPIMPITPFELLADRKVHYELRLAPVIVDRIAELQSEQSAIARTVLDLEDRRLQSIAKSKANWSEIRAKLSDAQNSRLASLSAQSFSHRSLLIDSVRDALNLNDQQREIVAKAIADLERDTQSSRTANGSYVQATAKPIKATVDETLRALVDNELSERLSRLRGSPFAFTLYGQVELKSAVSMHSLGVLAALVSLPDVQRELQISASNRMRLKQIIEDDTALAIALFERIPPIDSADQPSATELNAWRETAHELLRMRKQLEVSLVDMLAPEQRVRLVGLLLQVAGSQAIVLSDSARSSLGLSDEQSTKLKEICDANLNAVKFATITGQVVSDSRATDALLSESQRQQLESMKGAPLLVYPK